MKSYIAGIVGAFLLLGCEGDAQQELPKNQTETIEEQLIQDSNESNTNNTPFPDYELVWSDEFDGDVLDESKWSHRYPNRKRKFGYISPKSIVVSHGTLKNTIYIEDNKTCVGMIGTEGKFETKYGYFEMRAKLPNIKGPQSAFWLQSPTYGQIIGDPENSGVEIDIFEYVKTDPTKVHFTIHWDGYGEDHKKNYYGLEYPQIQDGDWHTFGLLWRIDAYEFYVDGILRHTKTVAISNVNQYMIISADISGWGGSVDGEILPDQFEIDYVRVYQKP